MSCRSLAAIKTFNCSGPLTFIPQGTGSPKIGTYILSCTPTEEISSDYDCICSSKQAFSITTCSSNSDQCSYGNTATGQCSITKQGTFTNAIDILPLSCTNVLVSRSCTTKCRWKDQMICKNEIHCNAPLVPGKANGGSICTAVPSNVGTPNTESTGTTVIALGVVTGLAILALVITLVLVCLSRRHKRGTPPTDHYTDMNVGEIGITTYESPLAISSKHDPLQNECSNANNRTSAIYMDIDNQANEQSLRITKQNHGMTDSVYNSIDECNDDQGYVQAEDLKVHRSPDPATLDDITTASANCFVLEKEEEKSEDTIQTEDYFVLEKDENGVTSNPANNHTGNGIVNGNKSDNVFTSERQKNQLIPGRLSGDNYWLLEKETKRNTNENIPTDDTYNILKKEVNSDNTDDYSHVRVVGRSQDGTSRERTVDSEDYDKLFQRHSSIVIRGSHNEYDHMNLDDDPLTFI